MYTDQVWNNEHSDHELMPGALCMMCALMGGGEWALIVFFSLLRLAVFVFAASCVFCLKLFFYMFLNCFNVLIYIYIYKIYIYIILIHFQLKNILKNNHYRTLLLFLLMPHYDRDI
jgi:hypothetical protein